MIKNAVIKSVYLGREDHGIPTCYITLDYGGVCQAFGGYDLRHYGINFIMGVLDALKVKSWEDLPGTHCRADSEHSKVTAIGHILGDTWYEPGKAMTGEKA